MAKRIVLFVVALIAAGVCGQAQDVRFTADPAVKKIQVLDIQSTVSCPHYKDRNRVLRSLYDDNLLSEWSATFDNKENTEDVVFTLSDGHIGSFLIYSYSFMIMECGAGAGSYTAQKNCAAVMQLLDAGSGKKLGEYRLMADKNTPFIAVIDKDLTPCQNGQFKLQMRLRTGGQFDSAQFDDADEEGPVYGVVCIQDISFWKDKVMNPIWPVGDRARFELRGPVKKVIATDWSGEMGEPFNTLEFDREEKLVIEDGIESEDYHSFYLGDVAVDYIVEEWGSEDSVHFVRRYDHYGRLEAASAHWDVPADYVEGPGWSGHYVYSEEGLLIESKEVAGKYKYYTYENGQLILEHFFYDDWEGFDIEKDIKYTIISLDKYGNWTKRKCECSEGYDSDIETYIQERTIIYY